MIFRKLKTLLTMPRHAIASKLIPYRQRAAERYLQSQGANEVLRIGAGADFKPDVLELAHLHQLVRERKPRTVLEFGSGYSTLILAHALHANGRGKVYSVEASQEWRDNTASKVPAHLQPHVDLRVSSCRTIEFNGRICHVFDELPDIAPQLIYLDGPNPADVKGSVRGLGFSDEAGRKTRTAVSADILLYEPSLPDGCTIVIDTRMTNTSFLLNNLQRKWIHKWDSAAKIHTLTLRDWVKR